MPIQWYPGHMTKARRELAKVMPAQDVVIEVVDARMPWSSSNPLVRSLRKNKPCIRVLSKADLAEPQVTDAWLAALKREASEAEGAQIALASSLDKAAEVRKRVTALCHELAGPKRDYDHVNTLICGIPNVGKSTLINTLLKRTVANVSDKPAVTKVQQKVVLPGNVVLTDTPGLMWPKVESDDAGYRLALMGSIPSTAIDYVDVGMFGARFLLERYPDRLTQRFKLKTLPDSPMGLLEAVGRKRGCLRKGGEIELHRAAEILIHELRQGQLGRISLERPEDVKRGAKKESE